jgi:hypothetical protein
MKPAPDSKKPRVGAKLKTLPPERQSAIVEYALLPSSGCGRNTVSWLAATACKLR